MNNRLKLIFGLAAVALCIPLFALTGAPMQEEDFLGASTCEECHPEQLEKVAVNIHGRLGEHEMDQENSCELCHGAASEHAFSEGAESVPRPFNEETADRDVAACAACHTGGKTMGWHQSEHAISGTTCLDCHDVKEPFHRRSYAEQTETCLNCHADQVARFNLPSHHPVTEGKMGCLACHNPHGANDLMLNEDTTNDLCLECHADKHGPFLYEHEPVMENCLTCHAAKGAMNNNLLVAPEASLCMRCHPGHEDVHPGERLGTGGRPFFLGKCSRCHSQIHGSDLPGFVGPSRFVR